MGVEIKLYFCACAASCPTSYSRSQSRFKKYSSRKLSIHLFSIFDLRNIINFTVLTEFINFALASDSYITGLFSTIRNRHL